MQSPDFEALEQIAVDCENEPNFDFNKWANCSRCAIGSFVLNHPEDELKIEKLPGAIHPVPIYQNYSGVEAIARRLRISYWQANRLFVPNNHPDSIENDYLGEDATKEEVAANIRKFIKGG